MPGVGDSRCPVDVDPGVMAVHDERLACVKTHPNSERVLGEACLCLSGGLDRLPPPAKATKKPSPSVSTSTPRCLLITSRRRSR